MEVSKNSKASPEAAPAQTEQQPDVAQLYISAPPQAKNRARAAIGAQNDDEAVRMIQSDPKVAAVAAAILSQPAEEPSLIENVPQTAAQDVLYPRRA